MLLTKASRTSGTLKSEVGGRQHEASNMHSLGWSSAVVGSRASSGRLGVGTLGLRSRLFTRRGNRRDSTSRGGRRTSAHGYNAGSHLSGHARGGARAASTSAIAAGGGGTSASGNSTSGRGASLSRDTSGRAASGDTLSGSSANSSNPNDRNGALDSGNPSRSGLRSLAGGSSLAGRRRDRSSTTVGDGDSNRVSV